MNVSIIYILYFNQLCSVRKTKELVNNLKYIYIFTIKYFITFNKMKTQKYSWL